MFVIIDDKILKKFLSIEIKRTLNVDCDEFTLNKIIHNKKYLKTMLESFER